ncbi:mandelate racemase/muconate lactonizing enzyme family protein [Tropicimonas marinistellae]|uniref:mandelate racemase/muconate lactonizing enzyme family protein n=1 Tax=Tropicimonas marinistellae TaxID=1739787 RepID=UPI00082A42D9|nr:mandelate racemase/muconate lactonizing enzyme family protein [Tropicimonas marinistellae]
MKVGGDRIQRVEGFEIGCDLPEPMGNALRTFTRRSVLLLRITTFGGLTGWGETWAFPEPAGAFIRKVLAPEILGADATAPRALHAAMMQRVVPDRRGLAVMAVSAVDIAAWDAFGHAVGLPIGALLGGTVRPELTAYASGPLLPEGPDRYRELAVEIEGYLGMGFKAVKIRAGLGPEEDERAIRRVRNLIGPQVALMVDLNEASNLRDTQALASRTADVGLSWIEEPVRHDDLPSYRRLAETLSVRVAGGESFCGVQAFRDPLAMQALDVIQPDVALCGGISETVLIAGLAEAFGVPLIPHVWGGPVNFLAAMQVAAAFPGSAGQGLPQLECDMSHNPFRDRIISPEPDRDGTISVPGEPGLGTAIDIEKLSDFVTGHWVLE